MKFEIRNSNGARPSSDTAMLEVSAAFEYSRPCGRAHVAAPEDGRAPMQMPIDTRHAFTLIELLVVIAIIGILAAIAMPTLQMFKPNPLAAASRQLLDDLSYARHKALADHTTVYVVFMPGEVNLDQNLLKWSGGINPVVQQRMLKAQYNGYALYERRQIGDQ